MMAPMPELAGFVQTPFPRCPRLVNCRFTLYTGVLNTGSLPDSPSGGACTKTGNTGLSISTPNPCHLMDFFSYVIYSIPLEL